MFIRKVARPTAVLACDTLKLMLPVVDCRHTVTLDNGREFSHHGQVLPSLGCTIYFARPYHRWKRGANENVNSLIRQYFLKRTNFDDVTKEQVQTVGQAINLRPRKRLGYKVLIEFIDQLVDFSQSCAVNT